MNPRTPQTFEDLVQRAREVPYSFPSKPRNRMSEVCTCEALRDQVAGFANTTRPIVHARVPALVEAFLDHKRAEGTAVERALYASMTAREFFDRLLKNRPLAFLNPSDSFLLRSGEEGWGGFEKIGTDRQQEPLVLERLLSYDEIQIAALMGVSVPTRFINRGDRRNQGAPGPPGSFEESGVYVGLVGARFEKEGLMEWAHIMVTPEQNQTCNGYGPDPTGLLGVWARFYGLRQGFPLFEEVQKETARGGQERFLDLGYGAFFDARVYKARMRMSVEPFLLDAALRASEEGRRAYVHAVGLGLGVWRKDPRQGQLLCDVFAEVIRDQASVQEWVAELDFSWFHEGCHLDSMRDGDRYFGVRVHFSQRDPAAPVENDRLLVAMYAWDGNAFPGNEYWQGALTASGDPAAACCSMIPELQNPDINLWVSGSNVRTFD
jgi:hypothetical protein